MLQLSIGHDPSHTIHLSEGHRQLKCQAYTFKENTVRDSILYLCMRNVFCVAGQAAGWCIYAQDYVCEVYRLNTYMTLWKELQRGGEGSSAAF